ncbi:hypothetical protein K8I61_03085 [bacterium]|nr:hypothetical protein [bacterium]
MTRAIRNTAAALALILAVMTLAPAAANASFILFEEGANHPELDWKYVETEHFVIYYYPEVEMFARYLYKVAEDIYEHDARTYNYELYDKLNVVLIDTEDYSNGWAAHNFNWITLWASTLYYPLRGRAEWIDDVFAHELAHIISLKSASKFRENFFGVLIGGSRTSRKYNFDAGAGIIYGTETLPTWMIEGVAQYDAELYGGDLYDSHREMIMRMMVLEDHMLTIDEMDINYDSKASFQREMVYNSGFSLNTYIGEVWGLDAPAKMWHEAGAGFHPFYGSMVEKELGMTREQLYDRWKTYLTEKYNRQVASLVDKEVKGFQMKIKDYDDKPWDELTDVEKWHFPGQANFHTQYSPDGEYVAAQSSYGNYSFRSKIYIKKTNPDPTKINDTKPIEVDSLYGSFSWSPDSKMLIYAKLGTDKWRGYQYTDLHIYEVEGKKKKQVTHQLRASEPTFSPNGDKIAFIINKGGSQKLAVMEYPRSSGHHMLLDFDDLTQLGTPQWSPDGSTLCFFMFRERRQDLWLLDADGSNLRPLTFDHYDNRDPYWSPDGKSVVFSSDRTGIFNLYSIDIETRELTQLTNVLGGAFMPYVKSDGSAVTYAYFTSWGYRSYEIPRELFMNKKVEDFRFEATPEDVQYILAMNDPPPQIVGRDYDVFNGFGQILPIMKDHRGTWVWIPIVNYDDARLQVGAQVLMADAVDTNLIFLVVYVGEEQRYSVFYENYMLPVTTFLSLHRIFPSIATDFEFFNFDVKANFDASFYFIGTRWGGYDSMISAYYSYQDIRVEQPSTRVRQITSRALNLGWSSYTTEGHSINPTGGRAIDLTFTYASPKIAEPFTGAKMGTDLADFYSSPDTITLEEARHYPDSNYLLNDYGYVQGSLIFRKYLRMPFWHDWKLEKLNDVIPAGGFDWEDLELHGWHRKEHTLALKGQFGYTHSTVPEGYGYGNSFGRVNFYDRFHGGGMFVTGLGAFSDNGAFLGYENYSLEGETMAVVGFDYRFPLIREIDAGWWAFYFDKLYFSFFANTGNYWSHVNEREDMFDLDKVLDKTGDGQFNVNDDLISDAGIEVRMAMFLLSNNWDSFIKIAHGFQDREREERPFRFYLGLGTGFDE